MIEIEIKDDEITAGLSRLALALGDMTPVMRNLGEYFVTSTKERFGTGAAPDGSPWVAKSPVTMEGYRKRGDRPDPRPLFGPSLALSTEIFHQARADEVRWGSPQPYAATMQFGAAQGAFGRTARGGPIPWGSIPARPFLGLSDDDRTEVLAQIADWVERAATIS